MKPFRVSAQWILYAHQPAAEDNQPAAAELCDLITKRDYVLIPADRGDLVKEVISVAELYSTSYGGDREDRLRAANASRLIKRATKWLSDVAAAVQS
jgi:hypothetical protein